MRYLMRFESYSDPAEFEQISEEEWNYMITNYQSDDNFTDFEISKLDDIFKKWKNNRIWFESRFRGTNLTVKFKGEIFGETIGIDKLADGWFVVDIAPAHAYIFAQKNNRRVESYSKYYKCDQIEGIVKYLDSLK